MRSERGRTKKESMQNNPKVFFFYIYIQRERTAQEESTREKNQSIMRE